MNGKGFRSLMARRLFLAGLGAGAGVVGASVVSSPASAAEGAADAPWRPARHTQDDWYDKVPGVHRYLFDSSSGEGMGWALQFASNYYAANQNAYGLKDSDLAVIIVARHKSTSFALQRRDLGEVRQDHLRAIRVHGSENQGASQDQCVRPGGRRRSRQAKWMQLIKKGVQFAVCSMSTRGISTRIAKANGLEVDAVFKEITSNLIGNAHMVPAGILAVNRAQEHGYSFVYAI